MRTRIWKRGHYHVERGGSWFSDAQSCRAANRLINVPGFRGNFLGFRLVRRSK